MTKRPIGWMVGAALVGITVSTASMANGGPLDIYNLLGVYVGAGLGRSTLNEAQLDQPGYFFQHIDGHPLGWNATVGIRPISFLGAEAEYIDFGSTRAGAGPAGPPGGTSPQFLGGDVHDRAATVFAVGYLPLPIPWIELVAKLGFGQVWQHSSFGGSYANQLVSGAQTTHPSGAAYGGGVQFHFQQLAVRAQYERISGNRSFGAWDKPALLSVGVNWTF